MYRKEKRYKMTMIYQCVHCGYKSKDILLVRRNGICPMCKENYGYIETKDLTFRKFFIKPASTTNTTVFKMLMRKKLEG